MKKYLATLFLCLIPPAKSPNFVYAPYLAKVRCPASR